jgi:hypothetical protein
LADAANSVKNPPLHMLNSLEIGKFTVQLAHFYPAEPQRSNIAPFLPQFSHRPVAKTSLGKTDQPVLVAER